jgi:hypothetical protein
VRVVGTLPANRAEARAAALRWLWSDALFRNEVLAEATPPGTIANAASDGTHALVLATSRRGSTISADVDVDPTAGPATIAIRETWHPRWTATIDGARVAIRRIAPAYMAVDVPAGRHALELRFRRPAWTWWLWLLWPALVLAAWLANRSRPAAVSPPCLAAG